jgi:hypothetical protein
MLPRGAGTALNETIDAIQFERVSARFSRHAISDRSKLIQYSESTIKLDADCSCARHADPPDEDDEARPT